MNQSYFVLLAIITASLLGPLSASAQYDSSRALSCELSDGTVVNTYNYEFNAGWRILGYEDVKLVRTYVCFLGYYIPCDPNHTMSCLEQVKNSEEMAYKGQVSMEEVLGALRYNDGFDGILQEVDGQLIEVPIK